MEGARGKKEKVRQRFGDSSTQRRKYVQEVSQGKIAHYINHTYEAPPPAPFESMFFTSQEAVRVLHPHNDAIVVSAPAPPT